MAQLSDYNTPARQMYLAGTLHDYRRRWWNHWRRRCDVCGERKCEWADNHDAAMRELKSW